MLPVSTSEECRFSVLTACLPDRSQHLAEAADSVERARKAIAPLCLEWIIALDGPGAITVPASANTVVQLASRGGISVARNTALARAGGDLIVPLDADDALVAAGLIEAHQTFEATKVGWTGANRVLLGSGERTAHWHGPRSWEPGEFAAHWTAPLAFHPNSFVASRDLVLRCGGWPALPANEDLLLVMLMSEHEAGASIEEVLTEYRVWEGQEVSSQSYPATKLESFRFIEHAINAVRQVDGREPVAHPSPGGAHGARALKGTT